MAVLTSSQRSFLESTVIHARKAAEIGARNALQTLAVDQPEPFAHMEADQRSLRNRLRHKARLLGDVVLERSYHQIDHLVYELAYEYWHQMLFAKFLEANSLLMYSEGVSVSMADCEELAAEEGFADKWTLAAHYASKMLPAIFRPEDPLMQVTFATEDRLKLESLLDKLEEEHFTADDSLGWVYQFWQSEAKAAINASGDKIDGERLPAVTQLFTEPYMVHFLIDNTLGAWWVSRNPGVQPPVKFDYLRLLEDGTPAAGKFEGWPDRTAEVTSLDPCMGSGHFVASLFSKFAKLRMHEEGLDKEAATDKVITENLHGLELDPRCTQIAAFNLALTAWKFCGQYRVLPEMNLACSGVAPTGKAEDWERLAGTDKRLRNGMKLLFQLFKNAPELGSLLEPGMVLDNSMAASAEELLPVLEKAIEIEKEERNEEQAERGVVALGIASAAKLLTKKYTLQITNVPYLARGKQDTALADYASKYYPDAKSDLANIFLDRLFKTAKYNGVVCTVIPQNWLFLTSYKKFREKFLKKESWQFIARLGSGAFSQISGEVVKAILISIQKRKPADEQKIFGIDVSDEPSAEVKDRMLKVADLHIVRQVDQLGNPDCRVVLEKSVRGELLDKYASSYKGITTGDDPLYRRYFWELNRVTAKWKYFQSTVKHITFFGGCESIVWWDRMTNPTQPGVYLRAQHILGKQGIAISQMSSLPSATYLGYPFDTNVGALIPNKKEYFEPILAFCQSEDYNQQVRKIDQALKVTNATLVKIPFDLEYWQKIAKEIYPDGHPKPYSDDPTQCLFHGNPLHCESPLQVAVARALGYRWPAEDDKDMELDDKAKDNIKSIKEFDELSDEDGILCIPSVNGEMPAADRLRDYLMAVYGSNYTTHTIEELLQKEGSKKANLDEWLRDDFFEQHCLIFQNRPFIWYVWDGRKDGFSALVNYHKLTKENLQKLIYTYLGDWIRQCELKKKKGESGADGLLIAATKLKEKLELILEGEAPYDIFVRWKPSEKQPIGWDPDLNDGVRLNIRPFVEADVLRKKVKVKWGIDRGKNPADSSWGEIRDNDKHLTLEEKRIAQAKRPISRDYSVTE